MSSRLTKVETEKSVFKFYSWSDTFIKSQDASNEKHLMVK